jgi:hypothetical protein
MAESSTSKGRDPRLCTDLHRLKDETGEWEVIGRPLTTAAGKTMRVRVRKVGQPRITDLRIWGAHKRICVRCRRESWL